MSNGGLDAKYLNADIEARVKGVAFAAEKNEEPGESKRGVLGTMLALGTGLMRKDAAHV